MFGTQACDVLYHDNLYYIVGSTTDPSLATGGAFHPLPNGGVANPLPTGFIASAGSASHPLVFASYFLAAWLHQSSGLTSVSAWSEYPDHLAVAGWTEGSDGVRDIVVATLFRDSTPGGSSDLQIVRQHRIPANGDEAPGPRDRGSAFLGAPTLLSALTALPSQHAFGYTQAAWDGLRDFNGGGLAVDPRGRLTVVGATKGVGLTIMGYVSDYPALGSGSAGAQVLHDKEDLDAVFSVVEMLPDGVCRSDGTGSCPPPGWSPVGNGGTTPACALSPFGMLPAASPPILKRMFLDYEGTPGSGYVSLVVDRPPPSSWVAMSAWHIGGVPAPTPFFDAAHEVELWFATPASLAFYPVLTLGGSARETWSALPLGFTYMAQYVCLLTQPLAGTPCTGTTLDWAATPAMVFSH